MAIDINKYYEYLTIIDKVTLFHHSVSESYGPD